MKIAVIGTGYVGLVTGTCLASIGHQVICCDNNEEKIKILQQGGVPIYEPGLDALLQKNIQAKRISFTTSIAEATKNASIVFIAVGTPPKKNGDADLIYIENVARAVAKSMKSYKLIVEKSTVPAQTGDRIKRIMQLNAPKHLKDQFDVASNPEFLREGSAIQDFMHPDRIVIGVSSKKAEQLLKKLYQPLKANILVTNVPTAELIKHASNSFLATKISFINSVSQICDRVGADIEKVAEGMGYDQRIGRSFLNAGIGYGGSCFPKDVDAFIRLAEKNAYNFSILKSVREVNEYQKRFFVAFIEDKLWNLKNKTIAVWGLSFKPNTDDMRSAPSIDIIQDLQAEGVKIKAYDPVATENAKKIFKNVEFCANPYQAVEKADALLLLTEWPIFQKMNFSRVAHLMNEKVIFDGRNFLDVAKLKKLMFEYHSIGRGQNA